MGLLGISTALAGALLLAACGGSGGDGGTGDGGGTPPPGSGDGNDTFAAAQAVAIGVGKAGVISSPTDEDWYSFTTPGAGQVTVTLDGLSADADLGLYSASQVFLSGSSNTGTVSDTVTSTAAGAANFRAVVLPAAASASYTLTVTFTGAVGDGNDTFDTAQTIAIGTTISSEIASSTDYDWYRVTTPGAGTITVTLDGMNVGADLELFGTLPSLKVGFSYFAGTQVDAVSYTAGTAITYRILVIPQGAASTYTLRATFAP